MTENGGFADVAIDSLFPVEFKVYSKDNLRAEESGDKGCEAGMNVTCKHSSLVRMS